MTKSDSVSIYRRFSAPLRGKIIGVNAGEAVPVYSVKVTSRNNRDYAFGDIVDVCAGDIYDTHRPTASGFSFFGKKWMENTY